MSTNARHSTLGPLGVGIPQIGAAGIAHDHRSFAAHAERLGYGAVWTSELTTTTSLDPTTLLAHVGAATTRISLGIAVLLLPLHQPVRLANQLATLDVLSSGRLTVGFGLGSNPGLGARYGVPTTGRLDRYLDGIDLIRRLWCDADVTTANDLWAVEGHNRTVRPTLPRVLIGARQPAAVERAARLGDGWIVSGSAPPEEIAQAHSILRRTLDEIGRDPSTFVVARRVYVAVGDGPVPMIRMQTWFAEHYGNAAIADRSAIVGPLDRIAEFVAELHDSGVDHVILNPVFDEDEHLDTFSPLLA